MIQEGWKMQLVVLDTWRGALPKVLRVQQEEEEEEEELLQKNFVMIIIIGT